MDDEEKICAQCKNSATQKCTGCQEVYYCNREHQRLHWKIHAKNCRPYKVATNAQLGRHFVATRDIKVGEVVLHEKAPLLLGLHLVAPSCLGCCDVLSKDNVKPCANCGWPLCHKCTKHGPECEFAKKYQNPKFDIAECGVPNIGYEAIGLVQALALRETDPKKYKKLMELEDHCVDKARRFDILKNPHYLLANYIKKYYNVEDVEEAEIARIAGIIEVNSFETEGKLAVAVFEKSSYFEHSCRANCSKTFTADGGIIFWAAVPICKGSHMSINYINSCWSTRKRRNQLNETKFFDCACERCTDPTEFGTMFSAFKCFKDECSGFILPPTFLLPDKDLDFACSKCNTRMSRAAVFNMEAEMDTIISSADQGGFSEYHLDAYNRFAEKHAKLLHENHFFQFAVDIATVGMCMKGGSAAGSNQLSNDRIVRYEKAIELLKILGPSEYSHIGAHLYLLYKAKSLLDQKKLKNVKNIREVRPLVMEWKKLLEQAYELLRRERPSSNENMIAKASLAEIQTLQALENRLAVS